MSAARNNFVIISEHVPGVKNETAEALSLFQIVKVCQLGHEAHDNKTSVPPLSDILWTA